MEHIGFVYADEMVIQRDAPGYLVPKNRRFGFSGNFDIKISAVDSLPGAGFINRAYLV